MNNNDYIPEDNRRWKFDSVSKVFLGSMIFSLIGGVAAVIGYKQQKAPNHDIWTHALNGCLTGGLIGAIALLILHACFRKQK